MSDRRRWNRAECCKQSGIAIFLRVWRGQKFFPVKYRIGPCHQAHDLGFAGKVGASGRKADGGFWHGDAGGCDHSDQFKGIDGIAVGKRCSRHRYECIDRHTFGMGRETGEDLKH